VAAVLPGQGNSLPAGLGDMDGAHRTLRRTGSCPSGGAQQGGHHDVPTTSTSAAAHVSPLPLITAASADACNRTISCHVLPTQDLMALSKRFPVSQAKTDGGAGPCAVHTRHAQAAQRLDHNRAGMSPGYEYVLMCILVHRTHAYWCTARTTEACTAWQQVLPGQGIPCQH
jgi:hypothetical protein